MERLKQYNKAKNLRRSRFYEKYTQFSKNKSSDKNTEKTGFINRTIIQLCICGAIFLFAFFLKNINSPLALQVKDDLSKTINSTVSAQDVSAFFNSAKENYTNIKDMAVSVFSKNNHNNTDAQQNQSQTENQAANQEQNNQKESDISPTVSNSQQNTNSALNIEKTYLQSYIDTDPVFLNTVYTDKLDTILNLAKKEGGTASIKIVDAVSSEVMEADNESEIYDFDTGEKRINLPTNVNNDNLILPFELNRPLNGSVTSKFGLRINPVTFKKSFHYGVDIAGYMGEYIVAPADGTIGKISIGTGAYGNSFIINHSKGIKTFYGHCYKILVKVGQNVKAGEKIARVGSTGWSTGPHLHFEVYKDGMIINPQNYFSFTYS